MEDILITSAPWGAGRKLCFLSQEFDSREEQARVQEAAQILMDCVADIVDCHGLGPLRSMCNAMQLQRAPSAGTRLNQQTRVAAVIAL